MHHPNITTAMLEVIQNTEFSKMFLTTVLVIVTVLFFYKWFNMRPRNFPPGPMPLPIIGSIYNFPNKRIEMCIEKWSKAYGEIIGYMYGRTPTVFVTGVDNVVAALRKEEFQGRPDTYFVRYRSFHKRLGISMADGKDWYETRRFTFKHFRGLEKVVSEDLIKEEIDVLIDSVEHESIIQCTKLFSFPTVNVIWMVLSNKRFTLGDEKSKALLDKVKEFIRIGKPVGDIVTIFPFMRHIDNGFQTQCRINKEIQIFMRDVIEEHKVTVDFNSPRDLIDCYLVEMAERNKAGTNTSFTEEDLTVLCMDLFSAGAETSRNTLEVLTIYMILYPEVQRKLQEELDQVLDRSRRPNLEDQNKLPYTVAVINEVMRINTVVPITVPHRCTNNTTFNNYFIPEDSVIIIDLWCLGHSEKHWKEPNKFDPTRFIGENGQLIKYPFLHSFGFGRRACVADMLARNIIFLFFAAFFEKFSVALPEGDPLPSTEGDTGYSTVFKPFRIKVTNRY